MLNSSNEPHTIDSLLRVVEARDAEIVLLKLPVDKLKVQLLRQVRARFGASSEQLDDQQLALIEGLPLHELTPVAKTPKAQAANSEGFERSLPYTLPRVGDHLERLYFDFDPEQAQLIAPETRLLVERRQTCDRQRTDQSQPGDPGHRMDQSAELAQAAFARRVQHRAGAQEEQALESGVGEAVIEHRGHRHPAQPGQRGIPA